MNGGGNASAVALQPFDASVLVQMLVGLVLMFALMGVALLLIRRFGSSRFAVSGPLRVVAGLPLGPRERVVLLQVNEVRVLIGVTSAGIETLYVQGQAPSLHHFDDQLDKITKRAAKTVEMP